MDPVQITMLGVGVALAALTVTLIGSLRRDIDKRFDANEKRFEERFDGIDKRLDGIDKRLDGIDRRIDGIDARLRAVEQVLSEMKGRFAFVESYILRRTETVAGEAPVE